MKTCLNLTKIGLLLAVFLTFVGAKAQGGIDSLLLSDSYSVIFKVNSTELNPETETWLVDSLIPMLETYGPRVIFWGRSAASPEGPLDNNRRLASGRRETVVKLLNMRGFDTTRVYFDEIVEEYDLLIELMRQRRDTSYVRVRDLVAQGGDNLVWIKDELKRAEEGRLWPRLVQDYFPSLRAVRILALEYVKHIQAPVPELLPGQWLAARFPKALGIAQEPEQPEFQIPRRIPRPKVLALRTNLLYDAWYQPQFGWAPGMNIQVEYYPRTGHITYNAGFTFHNHKHWSNYQFFQVRDVDLEARWYFKPNAAFVGPFAGIDLHGSWYGIGFSKTKGWEGEGGGGGLTLGWTHYLSKNQRWRFDASIGLGYFYTRYDPYLYGNSLTGKEDGKYYYNYQGDVENFKRRNHQFQWLGPTQAGISITYVLLYRRNHSKGASFRRMEKGEDR